ncbi:MAG: ribonuclease HII [Deltaproteobacteria bacterium]|nr:ribonuclease HII [Deltaproteobacteria bacterium]
MRELSRRRPPIDFVDLEGELRSQGFSAIAGVDEVGRGCLAGPVVAAACILKPNAQISGLADSKQLSPQQRDHLFGLIQDETIAWAIGSIAADTIDQINILQASLRAMEQAVGRLHVPPDILLIDGRFPTALTLPQQTLVRGDARIASIAAASILAKVTRDRWMHDFEKKHPEFSFSRHKGYGTPQHLEELRCFGPTPIHRWTFQGVTDDHNIPVS